VAPGMHRSPSFQVGVSGAIGQARTYARGDTDSPGPIRARRIRARRKRDGRVLGDWRFAR